MMDIEIKKTYHSLEEAIKASFGKHIEIVKKDRIYGGSINDAYGIRFSNGEKVFLKTNSLNKFSFFQTEALGLKVLGSAEAIGVPKVLGMGIDEQKGFSFLLLEYIESAPQIENYWEVFGRQLAELHKAECSSFVKTKENYEKYGFLEDNFIGAIQQKNMPKAKWIDFYRDCRLFPQMKMAEFYFDSKMIKKCMYLLEHLDSYLREPEFPSLLHGDLWSGNVLCGNDGKAWILDPAVYVGDYETDLAMTQMFGSFPTSFYAAYNEVNPMNKDYFERKNMYQLYHYLNHLNLFGRMYLESVIQILNKYV